MSRENPRYVDPIELKAFLESNSHIQNGVCWGRDILWLGSRDNDHCRYSGL